MPTVKTSHTLYRGDENVYVTAGTQVEVLSEGADWLRVRVVSGTAKGHDFLVEPDDIDR